MKIIAISGNTLRMRYKEIIVRLNAINRPPSPVLTASKMVDITISKEIKM